MLFTHSPLYLFVALVAHALSHLYKRHAHDTQHAHHTHRTPCMPHDHNTAYVAHTACAQHRRRCTCLCIGVWRDVTSRTSLDPACFELRRRHLAPRQTPPAPAPAPAHAHAQAQAPAAAPTRAHSKPHRGDNRPQAARNRDMPCAARRRTCIATRMCTCCLSLHGQGLVACWTAASGDAGSQT